MAPREVVIVGAGVMGCAAAWQLSRRGERVTVLEQFEDAHSRGSSHGASRIFRLGYPDPFWVRLAAEALAEWSELEQDANLALIARTGSVDHGDPEGVGLVLAALDAEGVPVELLTPEVASERWPGMRFSGTVVFQAGGGRIASGAARLAMVKQAQARGARFRWQTAVRGIETQSARPRLLLDDGVLDADVVVLATGAWIADRCDDAGIPLPPLRVTQESVFHFAPREHPSWWPSLIRHGSPVVYGLETPGIGVKLAEHHTGPDVHPDTCNRVVDAFARERVVEFVRAWMPGLDATPVDEVTCLSTTTATEDFLLDRVGSVVIASPCSGHGFKFAPLVGRMIADLVDGGAVPARFRLRRDA